MRNSLFPLELEQERFDFEEFKKDYARTNGWGLSASLDLKACDPKMIRSPDDLKQYIDKLCDLIEMKKFGEPIIVFFGEDPAVSGYSITQLIETSLISGHFSNQSNSAFIDIFSCKLYNPLIAATFTKDYFKASSCQIGFVVRG
jgi:S-adenosylmethionine/arginine decarboxylase-like enzyme